MTAQPSLRRGSSDPAVVRRQTTYASSLTQLSKTPSQPELFSKVHYQTLARYISTASAHDQRIEDPSALTNGNLGTNTEKFIHVVIHTFFSGNPLRREDFDLKDGLTRFVTLPQPETTADQVVFVRGSLSPAWIDAMGTKYKIDPEFFRRHLRYLPGRDHADLPSLPSTETEMMTLILPSLFVRSHLLTPEQIKENRGKDTDVARKNQTSIAGSMNSGETVIRRFSTLSDQLFAVEHEISIFRRSKKNGGQIAIVLLDNGLEMNRGDGPPCFSAAIPRAPMVGISPIPVIVPRPSTMNINVPHAQVPRHQSTVTPTSIGHVASFLPFYLGTSAHSVASGSDVFALISEVLRLVAGAECQYLNRLRYLIQDQQLNPADGEDMDLTVDTIRYIQTLLEDHRLRLKQNISFLETRCFFDSNHGNPTVATSVTSSQQAQAVDELASVLADFKELLTRAKNLKEYCTETVGLILNGAMLRESQKAIQRADDQRRLTVLAYLFLPLSLVASIFGMNVKELGTGSQHIWLPFVVLAPVGCISWVLFHPQSIEHALKSVRQILRQGRTDHHTHGATIPLSSSTDNDAGSA